MSRGPDGRYGYQDATAVRLPVPVTCHGCGDKLTGRFHRRAERGEHWMETWNYCDACVPKRRFEAIEALVCEWCRRAWTINRHYYRACYCTTLCGQRSWRERTRLSIDPSVRCATCRHLFTPARDDARYCSPACRQRAYRQRQAEQAAKREYEDALMADYNERLGWS